MKLEDVEEFTAPFQPISRPGSLKMKAVEYLGKVVEDLSKKDIRKVESKAKKMKKSSIKADRHKNHELAKQVDLIDGC